MPDETPVKLARAKMGMLIRRGLVDGCTCGCRGDFELTAKGADLLSRR
jgi:predicted transcriptional regulator